MTPALAAWRRALVLAGVVVIVDQTTKAAVAAALAPGEQVDLALGLDLTNVRNTGIAFGLLADGELPVIAFTTVALALILVDFARRPERPHLWLAAGLLVGGALGNLADRVRDGAVVDFVDAPLWPAFNVADVAITAGIVLLVVVHTRPYPRPAQPAGGRGR